ncbi:beta-galactosidase [Plantactinospora sonchi]|uniref:Beta-galactosidase n=1 Tax=Plantactinospora sonchi TaxID=1544735 RepID=A0ABU7S4L6_9ACTN
MRWPKGSTGLCYGGDYNPEQWPPEVWAEDVALMRRARVNLVTVGVFAWSRLEPRPGRYDFDWLDRVLDLLHGGGVRVALATPTASPPPWFSLRHPDALPVTADGVRLSHGSRDTYCASAPAYRTAAGEITAALAARYADHPALAMWRVHNEYGTTCHCGYVTEAFRCWLRARYGGLDALNDAWTTSFWSQHYSAWEQIRTPVATQYLGNPSQLLDFRRFVSDELLGAYVAQRDLLRAATPDVPVTTNYVLGGWVPVDHARWSTEVDLVAIDHYPSEAGPGAEEQTAFAADLARGWARRRAAGPTDPAGSAGGPAWLLMESAPNLVLTPGRMHGKEPGRLLRHSLAHVARGSRGAMFFQWRASRGGAELFHSALLPHAGPESRAFREAVELGETLARLSEVDDGTVRASVAVAWDATCWWASQASVLPSARFDYADEVAAAHRALWRAGHGCDVVAPGDDLSGYALLVLPALHLVDDGYAEQVRAHLAGGGHLVVTYLSGIVDVYNRVRPGGYPGAFRDLLGIRVEEFHPLDPAERLALSDGGTGRDWSEPVELTGATAVTTYQQGRLAGRPAVTQHRHGEGVAWYVSTRLDDNTYRRLLADVARTAGVLPTCPSAPEGVEAVRRRSADGTGWLFLLNHTDAVQTVPVAGTDLLTGGYADPVTLPAGGCAVLREE